MPTAKSACDAWNGMTRLRPSSRQVHVVHLVHNQRRHVASRAWTSSTPSPRCPRNPSARHGLRGLPLGKVHPRKPVPAVHPWTLWTKWTSPLAVRKRPWPGVLRTPSPPRRPAMCNGIRPGGRHLSETATAHSQPTLRGHAHVRELAGGAAPWTPGTAPQPVTGDAP